MVYRLSETPKIPFVESCSQQKLSLVTQTHRMIPVTWEAEEKGHKLSVCQKRSEQPGNSQQTLRMGLRLPGRGFESQDFFFLFLIQSLVKSSSGAEIGAKAQALTFKTFNEAVEPTRWARTRLQGTARMLTLRQLTTHNYSSQESRGNG